MDPMQVSEMARALFRTHGDGAEDEATTRARRFDEAGQLDEAERWRAIRREIGAVREIKRA